MGREGTASGQRARTAPGSTAPLAALAALLGFARSAIWVLVLNCLQNLLLAPRTVPGSSVTGRPRVSILVPARDEAASIHVTDALPVSAWQSSPE